MPTVKANGKHEQPKQPANVVPPSSRVEETKRIDWQTLHGCCRYRKFDSTVEVYCEETIGYEECTIKSCPIWRSL